MLNPQTSSRNEQNSQRLYLSPKLASCSDLNELESMFGRLVEGGQSREDIEITRGMVGVCIIAQVRAMTALHFQRTWRQACDDGVDVAILCVVQSGQMSLVQASGEVVADSGAILIVKSAMPFSVECLPSSGIYQMLYLTVPMHRMRKVLGGNFQSAFCMPAEAKMLCMTARLVKDLFDVHGEMQLPLADQFLDLVLSLVGGVAKEHRPLNVGRRSLAEQRYADILHNIETHLSDPNLCIASVAEACGMSRRYVSMLLANNNTTFTELVWSKRIQVASEWLAKSVPTEVSVSEIAYGVGFKSPAHFSRLFRRTYKRSPTEYRKEALSY